MNFDSYLFLLSICAVVHKHGPITQGRADSEHVIERLLSAATKEICYDAKFPSRGSLVNYPLYFISV
jgi:hypothetical protein